MNIDNIYGPPLESDAEFEARVKATIAAALDEDEPTDVDEQAGRAGYCRRPGCERLAWSECLLNGVCGDCLDDGDIGLDPRRAWRDQ